MKAIRHNFIVCMVICVTILLLNAGFNNSVASAVTSTNLVDAYGDEAQLFVSMLSTEWADLNLVFDSHLSVIVVSDISLVNLQSVLDRMENGAILVAINLPEGNGLVDVPRHTFGSKQTIGNWVVSETLHENVIPPYWVIVTKQTEPSLTACYIGGTADDEQSHEFVMQWALESVNYALFPDVEYSNRFEVVTDDVQGNLDDEFMVWPVLSIVLLLVVGAIVVVILLLREARAV